MSRKLHDCLVRYPDADVLDTAATAAALNPANRPLVRPDGDVLTPGRLALLTTKYWGSQGVRLTVSFLDAIAPSLADHILEHMNAWGTYANVAFRQVARDGEVRISFDDSGYWSYLGTDILHIPQGQPTMNLSGFNREGIDLAEYHRVVRHETGHTLGFPHEHERQEIIALLDAEKTVAYMRRVYGWSRTDTYQQILTPLRAGEIRATPQADQRSIMCYDFPGECTLSGQPIPGGDDIGIQDGQFAAGIYPRSGGPEPPAVPLFTFSLSRSVPRGWPIILRAPVNVPAGTYQVTAQQGGGQQTPAHGLLGHIDGSRLLNLLEFVEEHGDEVLGLIEGILRLTGRTKT